MGCAAAGRRLMLVLLTASACSDENPMAPTLPERSDLIGPWNLIDSTVSTTVIEQTICRNRGVAVFSDTAAQLHVEMRLIGTCISPRGPTSSEWRGNGTNVTLAGDSVRFSLRDRFGSESCDYRGRLTGSQTPGASGVATCTTGREKSWRLTKGLARANPIGRIASIDVGSGATCALSTDGRAFCWGTNFLGQLGVGDDLPRLIPTPVAGDLTFKRLSLSPGGAFACGLTTGARAYCWGTSNGGRLGDGSGPGLPKAVTRPQPVVGGYLFTELAVGGSHACAITAGGDAYCWGNNLRGQLGTGNTTPSSRPIRVIGGQKFKSIDAHQDVTCGINSLGSAYCWGDGNNGVLGHGARTSSGSPVAVIGGLTFASINLGLWMACGVSTIGDGYCWGYDGYVGGLGTGTSLELTTVPLPVAGGIKWATIGPGVFVTCGVATNGTGYCWGDDSTGELCDGPGYSGSVNRPTPIAGNLKLASVRADWHVCGTTTSGAAYCWGFGVSGGIGDGYLYHRYEAAKVAGQP